MTTDAKQLSLLLTAPFVALAGDDFLDADDDLNNLIAQLSIDRGDHDVAVWDCFDSLAAVLLSDGTIHRFAPNASGPSRSEAGAPQEILRP